MLSIITTLINGASARNTERLTDIYAIDLIEQKIREGETALKGAKITLASLISRERAELRTLNSLKARMSDLEGRTRSAMDAGDEDLARDAAQALAELENERTVREDTLSRLGQKTTRMRASVEKVHRRIIDLRQGAVSARAVDAERKAQAQVSRTLGSNTSLQEADELVKRVLSRDDPFEQGEILDDIDAELNHDGLTERLARAGHGKGRTTADDILKRLSKDS